MKRSAATQKSQQPERQAILVLGMHRSGTSALSGVACTLGASAPRTLLPANFANPHGYWESLPLVQAHNELLESAGSSWDDWRRLDSRWCESDEAQRFRGRLQNIIESEYDEQPLFVVKDPRLCRFLPFFLSVLEGMAIAPITLFSVRDPLEVAFSLRRRDGFSISKSVALWLRHVLEAEFHSRQTPRCFVSYENLLKDWRFEMGRAGDVTAVAWPADFENSAVSIEKFLLADLYHERNESPELEKHPELLFLAAETYQMLLKASTAGADDDLLSRFDSMRAKFDRASDFFGAILRTEQESIQQLRMKLIRGSSELEQQRALVAEQKTKHQREFDRHIQQQERERSQYIAQVGALSGQLAELHDASMKNESRLNSVIMELRAVLDLKTGEQAHLLADLESSKVALDDMRRTLAANHDHGERLKADILCKQASIDDMNREINAYRKHAENLQVLLADRDHQNQAMMARIRAFYASRSWRVTMPLRAARRFFSRATNFR